MERYYRNNFQGCPHYTQSCPNSSGYSTEYYGDHYPQTQPYEAYRTQEGLNAWCREANEQYEKDIQAIIARIASQQPTNIERVVYDREGNGIRIETASGEVILKTLSLETIMDDVQIIVTEGEAQVPPLGKSSALDLSSDEVYTDSLQDNAVSCDTLHLSCENELVQKFHLLDESERLTDELANLRLARGKAAKKMGTLTEEVQLTNPQYSTPHPPSVYTPQSCGLEPIEDDFFSDDDEAEVEESSDDTVGDGPGKYSEPDLIEYNCDNLASFNFLGDELDSSNELDTLRLLFDNNLMQDIESEDECCEEGLPELDEQEEELEEEQPSVVMKEEVQVQEVINEPQIELVSDPPHCTQEKERSKSQWRMQYTGDDRSPHYMSCIRFGPGIDRTVRTQSPLGRGRVKSYIHVKGTR
ncbi:hypothetical protein L1987_08543 [Smallanthus sonchifolius]|uniref:Uncharacterized protein n=1 Tax=Smallanthus sonchifolius TaxID=185202 RepID=A0ACB9JKX2_9ASTR|nr:hypothetical protein L1987_08543 [Smallanthus sonchifolius]